MASQLGAPTTFVEVAQRSAFDASSDPFDQVLWFWQAPQRTAAGATSSKVDHSTISEFVCGFNAQQDSEHYGQSLSSLSLGSFDSHPCYAEYSVGTDGSWVVMGVRGMWLLDLADPRYPRLRRRMKIPPGLAHPRTVARLPDNRILVSFAHDGSGGPGGLALYESEGTLVRASSAFDPRDPTLRYRPFGLLPLPAINRLITTNFWPASAASAHPAAESLAPGESSTQTSHLIQIWRLSDLSLLHTIKLVGRSAVTTHRLNEEPFEMISLPDQSVLAFTRKRGGLWRVAQIANPSGPPKVELVGALSVADGEIGIPLMISDPGWILVPVGLDNALLVLDVRRANLYVAPREHSRFRFGPQFQPHWLSYDSTHDRVAVLDQLGSHLYLLHFDRSTGQLSADLGTSLGKHGLPLHRITRWPQGQWNGEVRCKGVVFGSYLAGGARVTRQHPTRGSPAAEEEEEEEEVGEGDDSADPSSGGRNDDDSSAGGPPTHDTSSSFWNDGMDDHPGGEPSFRSP